MEAPRGARSATCSTARFSETLILSPRNMASMRSRSPDSWASCKQQSQGLVGDPVLGIVEIDPGGFDRQPLAALAILGKELPQMDALDLLIVLLEQRPGGAPAQRRHAHRLLPRGIADARLR